MAPRDNLHIETRTVKKPKRVKLRRSRRDVEPEHRDAPAPRTAIGARDLPQDRPDPRPRHYATGKPVGDVDPGGVYKGIAKGIGRGAIGLAAESSAGMPLGTGVGRPTGRQPSQRQREDAEKALDILIGPNLRKAIKGGEFNPWRAAVEGALLPINLFSPLKSPTLATAGVRALRGAKEGAKTRSVAVGLEEATKPILRVRPRRHKLQGSVQEVAAARSRLGRAGEEVFDKAVRPAANRLRIPIVKSPEQVWARDAERRIVHDSMVEALPGVLADRAIKALNKGEKYALYSMGTETSPRQWIEFYEERIKRELGKVDPDKLALSAMRIHIANFRKAEKYVVQKGDSVEMVESSRKLARAYFKLQASSEAREAILTRGGYLDPDAIIARKSAPGRIARGARWTPEEEHAWNVIKASPNRQKLKEAQEATPDGMDPALIEAQLDILDHKARAHWEHKVDSLRKQQKTLEKKIAEILEKEEAGETINETTLRAYEEHLAIVSDKLEEGIPYDDLYRLLRDSGTGIPHDVRLSAIARYGAGMEFKKAPLVKQMAGEEFAASVANMESRRRGVHFLPRGFRAKASLEKKLAEIYDRAVEGLPIARNWYRDSGQSILQHAGGDVDKADDLAALTAIYSPQQAVIPNIGLALRAHREYLETGQVLTGQPWQIRRAQMVLEGKNWLDDLGDDSGLKIRSFYANLLKHIDPERMQTKGFTGREVTADGWLGAAYGYGDNTKQVALGNEAYRFIERTVQAIADDLGVSPEEAQAAIWVSIKASNDRYLRDLPREQALQRAGAAFDAGLGRPTHNTRFAFEAASDHMPEYWTWPPEVQQAFLDANSEAILAALQRNGFYGRITDKGLGIWRTDAGVVQNNPSNAIRLATGNRPKGDYSLTETERAVNDAVAGIIGGALKQDGAPWMTPMVPVSTAHHTHYIVAGDFPIEQLNAFEAAISEHGYVSQTADGFIVARWDPDEVLDADPETARGLTRAFTDAVIQAADEHLGGLSSGMIQGAAHRGGYLAGPDEYAAAVSRGRDSLAAGGRPTLLDGVARDVAVATEAVRAAFRADPAGAAARHEGSLLDDGGRDFDPSSHPDAGRRAAAIPRSLEQYRATVREGVLRPESRQFIGGAHVRDDPGSRVYVSENNLTPIETWTHELGHFWQHHLSPSQQRVLRRHYGDNKEDWVETWMEYVLDLYPQRSIPKGVRNSFDILSAAILKEADEVGGARFVAQGMPREIAEMFDTTLWYRSLKGGALRGAEDFTGGFYTAVERGFPVSLRHPLAASRRRMQALTGLFQGRSGVKRGYVDPSVKKHFTGRSVESGWIKIAGLGRASYNALLKAIRMDNVQVARAELLKASTETPTAADDIAIFVNPSQRAPAELKRYWETVEEMGEGLSVNELSIKELDELDGAMLEKLHLQAFPDEVDGKPVRVLAQEIIDGLEEPIEGIRWVSAKAFNESELFSAPRAFYSRTNNWGRAEVLGVGIDVVNDLMKLTLLPLNPAYAPMNLAGNLMLNLMQQGPFALMNIPRAAFLSRTLNPDVATAVDYYMGRGIMHLTETDKLARHATATVSNLLGVVVDVVPRRAAFLHEAYAMGFKTNDDVEQLLMNKAFRDELYEVRQRANDAIIDYERLSLIERKYLQRMLFIYPWIRGSTRYTFRFPAEHPIQAMAFAFLYERQQAAADEQLGERPWYAKFNIPIGEVERFGETYPLVLNPKQLLPFTTLYDLADWMAGWATGSDTSQSPVEALQPFYPALITSITGFDTFEQRYVGRGPETFVRQVADFPLRNVYESVGKSEEELAEEASNRLYPRNQMDTLLRAGLGTLAPTPYNPEKGRFYAAGKKGKTPEEQGREKYEEIEDLIPAGREEEVREITERQAAWKYALEDARKTFSTDDLTPEQEAEAMVDFAAQYIPYVRQHRDEIVSRIDASNAGSIKGELERDLGFSIVEQLTRDVRAKARDAEARAEGAVVGAG